MFMTSNTNALKELRKIPGVGKVVATDLLNLGYRSIADLEGEDPEIMYVRHNERKGNVQDICLLYTFRSVVYFADTDRQVQYPEKLKWWNWMDKQKVDSKTKDAQIRKKKYIPG
jgi:Pathogenicity locus